MLCHEYSGTLLCSQMARRYEQRRRAERQAETRRRIVEATVDLARSVDIPVIASGGVKGIAEIHVLALHVRDGVEGVITGRALYDGRLDLAAALSVAKAA